MYVGGLSLMTRIQDTFAIAVGQRRGSHGDFTQWALSRWVYSPHVRLIRTP